ncbi:gluconolactonase [Aspergillus japonicus CBS 114.51]|uniref:Gluconolactonase n=1 Tax=Aspergillus japonicus CBS 114.51 TaxID=1448312 RepID=A0A8T8WMW9_ASPJA|nr:gluconolactonase [Aspergillus japonicus CBS 114.51]RAH77198.1 gluconolactonase [Aspergillus japonicus CBS 114.51]
MSTCMVVLAIATSASLTVPDLAQIIDQASFNFLPTVTPTDLTNDSLVFQPPGVPEADLAAKPFHIYDEEFLSILGDNPTLTLIAESASNPLYHEAVVWNPPTDEVFFVQSAGGTGSGTGLNKSAIIQKISVPQAAAVSHLRNASGLVNVTVVPSTPTVINPNGGTYYKGNLLYVTEGQGKSVPPALYLMNPQAPYNTTIILNNYFNRQFNSLNDIAVHPVNGEIYFTDSLYGYLQDFRPAPTIRNQVYRFNPKTGAVSVVADGFDLPNGLVFSPDGRYAYVTDTGDKQGLRGTDSLAPATIYRYNVQGDGTLENRKVFAFAGSGHPDGIHCDSKGNVWSGCGDGVNVWSPAGKLLGKIYMGGFRTANFQFAGKGCLIITAETRLYYATLSASGTRLT